MPKEPTIRKTIPKPFPEQWANGYGEDKYGIWQSFSVNGVRCRLRRINPGAFLMGSPKSEPQRHENEMQHEVIISAGFWLAEAACTQELWREIMDENPSRFKGENLPVETVSWEDCQRFVRTINEHKSGLDLRLPSEAEWEYACRAGTVTPFSFGENITTDQVNYNGNYPYHNGQRGESRQTLVEVKSLPCNNWGLYEMHGNLWEWCNDWLAEYPSETVGYPVRVDKESSRRVLRGGGWFGGGGGCRSAYRNADHPAARYSIYGFRLARGQK